MEGLLNETAFAKLVANADGYQSFTLIDVGCSGGFTQGWRIFGTRLKGFGFDPNLHECERLKNSEVLPDIDYIPAFVGLPAGHPFLIQREQEPINSRNVWNRLSSTRSMAIRQNLKPEMTDEELQKLNLWVKASLADSSKLLYLPDFIAARQVTDIDFIKIDVDGEDFSILSSLEGELESKQVLGVGLEVSFDGSEGETENSFHNLDRFMRRNGFDLFGLTINRYTHAALPGIYRVPKPAETLSGRPIWGDAIYLRDLCAARNSELAERAGAGKLLKLAAIASLMNLPDVSAEILLKYGDQLNSLIDVSRGLDLLAEQAQADLPIKQNYTNYMAAFEADHSSFYTRALQGEYLERLRPGEAGRRLGRDIVAIQGTSGTVAHGPYIWMPAGQYLITFVMLLDSQENESQNVNEAVGTVDVYLPVEGKILASRNLLRDDQAVTLKFDISKDMTEKEVEFRVSSNGIFNFTLKSVGLSTAIGDVTVTESISHKTSHAGARVRALENEITAVYNSTSWRITSPLRRIITFIRKTPGT